MYGDAISMRVDKVVKRARCKNNDSQLLCARTCYLCCAVPDTLLTLHAGSTDFYRVVHGQGMQQLVLIHERRRTKCKCMNCCQRELVMKVLIPENTPLLFLHPAATTSFVWFPRILFVHWPR
jgi:hypothetical protein